MKPASPVRGISLMMLAVTFMPIKDGLAKMVGGIYSPVEILWVQFTFLSLVLIPIIVRLYGVAILWPRPFGLQILRGLFVAVAVGLFYWAITLVPLANATAVAFIAPLVVTALSPFVLGEKIGIRRWIAVVAGFSGVLFILQPDLGGVETGYLIALGSGVGIAFFYLTNRMLADSAPPLASVAYSVIIGAIVLTAIVPAVWVAPRAQDTPVILSFLVLSAFGQGFLVMSFNYAPASVLAPFFYCGIVTSTLFGFVVFGDFPDSWAWLGIAIVIASGIYVAFREAKLQKRAAAADAK